MSFYPPWLEELMFDHNRLSPVHFLLVEICIHQWAFGRPHFDDVMRAEGMAATHFLSKFTFAHNQEQLESKERFLFLPLLSHRLLTVE